MISSMKRTNDHVWYLECCDEFIITDAVPARSDQNKVHTLSLEDKETGDVVIEDLAVRAIYIGEL